MHPWLGLTLGSVLFAAAGCAGANPAGERVYTGPGGAGGGAAASTGTTDPGTRVFGADPIGGLTVETLPTVRPVGAGSVSATPWPVPSASPAGPGFVPAPPPPPTATTRRATPPPPPPPSLPPAPGNASSRHRPPPPPPEPPGTSSTTVIPAAPWPATPYPAGAGAPPMPPGARSDSGVLGPPPAGELPPPESHRVPR